MAWDIELPDTREELVTWMDCLATFGYDSWPDQAGADDTKPVICQSWYLSFAFCAWDGGRLPTEAEWNYAASGGAEHRKYPWGSMDPADDTGLAVYDCLYNGIGWSGGGTCAGVGTAPVGSAPDGAGKWGHADLAGNVEEWVSDWYVSPYPDVPCIDCLVPPCLACTEPYNLYYRAARGGGFDRSVESLLSAIRSRGNPDGFGGRGARCARD